MGRRKVMRRGCKRASKILVQTFMVGHGSEFYTIDLDSEKVVKLPMEGLGKEAIMTSLVALGSVIYLIGCDQTLPSSLDSAEKKKGNEKGYVHRGVSYIDIGKEGGGGEWKAAPPHPVKPPRVWLPERPVLCGKIYVFTYKANKAEVFDPKLNQWALLPPPPGVTNFVIQTPMLADHSNNRLLVSFQDPGSLYAYCPALARWDLLVPEFHTPSFIFAVDSGVIFSYVPKKFHNLIFTAFDVDSKQRLNLTFSSNFDQRLWIFEFFALLNLGNGILCLVAPGLDDSCSPPETNIFTIQFKVHRTSPLDVRITPFPGKFFSLQDLREPITFSAF